MNGYMVEYLTTHNVWRRAGQFYLARRDIEETLKILSYGPGEYRIAEIPIVEPGTMGSTVSIPAPQSGAECVAYD